MPEDQVIGVDKPIPGRAASAPRNPRASRGTPGAR
jgi:hypothetical protein